MELIIVIALIWWGVRKWQKHNREREQILRLAGQLQQYGADPGKAGQDFGFVANTRYLGGVEGQETSISGVNLYTPNDAIVVWQPTTERILWAIRWSDIHELRIETEEEASRRFTATRLVAMGPLALAFPKRTPGTVLITIDTTSGPYLFEAPNASKTQLLAALSKPIAKVRSNGAGPRKEPVVHQQDEPRPTLGPRLRELADLRDEGLLSEEEFQKQKQQLLDDDRRS